MYLPLTSSKRREKSITDLNCKCHYNACIAKFCLQNEVNRGLTLLEVYQIINVFTLSFAISSRILHSKDFLHSLCFGSLVITHNKNGALNLALVETLDACTLRCFDNTEGLNQHHVLHCERLIDWPV